MLCITTIDIRMTSLSGPGGPVCECPIPPWIQTFAHAGTAPCLRLSFLMFPPGGASCAPGQRSCNAASVPPGARTDRRPAQSYYSTRRRRKVNRQGRAPKKIRQVDLPPLQGEVPQRTGGVVLKWCVHTNSRLKGKKGPPARGAAPKGLGGVEPEKQPFRFADANHLPFQGRQSILNANWYKSSF